MKPYREVIAGILALALIIAHSALVAAGKTDSVLSNGVHAVILAYIGGTVVMSALRSKNGKNGT